MSIAIAIGCGPNPDALAWFLPAFAVLAFLVGLSHVMSFVDRWRQRGDEPGFAKDFTLDLITMLLFFAFVAGVIVFGFNVECIPRETR